jgi:predicted DNA-binding transcriptional regulator AlpA
MEKLKTMTDIAEMFGISRSTAFRLKRQQAWPCVRFGTEIRFTNEDVAAIIQMNHQKPAPPKTTPTVGTRATRRRTKQ